jgi:hypothetical protein
MAIEDQGQLPVWCLYKAHQDPDWCGVRLLTTPFSQLWTMTTALDFGRIVVLTGTVPAENAIRHECL